MPITVNTSTGRASTTNDAGQRTGSARTVSASGTSQRHTSGTQQASNTRNGGANRTASRYLRQPTRQRATAAKPATPAKNDEPATPAIPATPATPVSLVVRPWKEVIAANFPGGMKQGGMVRGAGKATRGTKISKKMG